MTEYSLFCSTTEMSNQSRTHLFCLKKQGKIHLFRVSHFVRVLAGAADTPTNSHFVVWQLPDFEQLWKLLNLRNLEDLRYLQKPEGFLMTSHQLQCKVSTGLQKIVEIPIEALNQSLDG